MAELFSRYTSGIQFTAGTMIGSISGASGLNPIVDRLNSISTDNNLITGSFISGTNTGIYASGGAITTLSGTSMFVNGSVGNFSNFLYNGHKTWLGKAKLDIGSNTATYVTVTHGLGVVPEYAFVSYRSDIQPIESTAAIGVYTYDGTWTSSQIVVQGFNETVFAAAGSVSIFLLS